MRMSQSTAHAVHAVLRLAEAPEGTIISCSRLAAEGKMPERYVLQILRVLSKKGVLLSTRGGRGGFALARRPDEISLLEVIEAVEGPMKSEVPSAKEFPGTARDRLSSALQAVNESLRRELAAVKISILLEGVAEAASRKKAKGR